MDQKHPSHINQDNQVKSNYKAKSSILLGPVKIFTIPVGTIGYVIVEDMPTFDPFLYPLLKIDIKCLKIDHILAATEYKVAKTDINTYVNIFPLSYFDNLDGFVYYQSSDSNNIIYDRDYLFILDYNEVIDIKKNDDGTYTATTKVPIIIQYTERRGC